MWPQEKWAKSYGNIASNVDKQSSWILRLIKWEWASQSLSWWLKTRFSNLTLWTISGFNKWICDQVILWGQAVREAFIAWQAAISNCDKWSCRIQVKNFIMWMWVSVMKLEAKKLMFFLTHADVWRSLITIVQWSTTAWERITTGSLLPLSAASCWTSCFISVSPSYTLLGSPLQCRHQKQMASGPLLLEESRYCGHVSTPDLDSVFSCLPRYTSLHACHTASIVGGLYTCCIAILSRANRSCAWPVRLQVLSPYCED